jgi:pleckstrin family protein A (phosphoinositide binding specific) protein 8
VFALQLVHPTDHLRFDIVMPGGRQVLYLKASSTVERQQWVVALGTSKQEDEGNIGKLLGPSLVQQVAVRSKMAELQANCQLLFSQVSNMRSAASSPSPDTENMQEMATLMSHTCDKFLKILSECMLLSTASVKGVETIPATPTDHSSPTSSFAPMKPLARVPHLLSDRPSPFPHSSAPLILPFLVSLPPSTTGLRNREASPKSTDQQTHSLPVHLVGNSSPSVRSPESTDGGERSQEKESPRKDEKSPVPSSRSHSRANSEAFVTPASTPTGSPPPSPPPHTPHSHTPQSSQGSRLLPSPQTPVELTPTRTVTVLANSQRIGDRFPRSTVPSGHESFFSRAPHKFEDLVLSDGEGIPTPDFLSACRAVVPFFDTLSSTAFAPVKADINGNIEKLSKRYQSNPEKFSTLQSMVVHELETNTHEARNSATDALLWLKRAIEFIQEFVAEVAGGEHSLDIAAGKAYTKCLRRYHNWIVRGMFSVSGISLVVYVQVLIRSYECCRNGGVYTHVMFTSFLLLPTVLFIGCNVIVCFLPQYPYARALVRFPTHPSQMPTQNVCIYLPLSKILL